METIDQTFNDFLTEDGRQIFDFLSDHLKENNIYKDVDLFELAVLSQAFSLYRKAAKIINDVGPTQQPEKGGWDQVSPWYTVLKNEYQNILKHSPKFLINPEARQRIFKGKLDKKKKVSITDGLD
jgi:P27 family predicted phage terminase small subunit